MDDMGDRAKDFASEHPDQVDLGTKKAGDLADDKTGGKYSDQIDTGQEKAGDLLGGGDSGGGDQQGSGADQGNS